ncbi:hypothetical protein EFM62_14265 [Enterococcus faecium]|nr:hypothetical protein [Enterococcus faecium]
MSLPFHSKPQGAISKNSSSYFMNVVLVIRSWQGNTVYSKKGVVTHVVSPLFFSIFKIQLNSLVLLS